ncbi:Uncharacterized protein CK203_057709 [Vitis vinifera]|uniref:Glutaredoxin domain-containing protein n=1 Tax=Vitis vinifera TaxID=29760 RepID=A0A438G0L0_VITVI|nr:Uncharacterized protein CK203_057709 [Vitis vinifera]
MMRRLGLTGSRRKISAIRLMISAVGKINRSDSHPSPTTNFSCSSFKDIQHLCKDETETQTPKKSSIFHRVRVATAVLRSWAPHPAQQVETNAASVPEEPLTPSEPLISIPGAESRIVVYFTSLRVVRSTFEDCRVVRSILRGFRVSMDERDLAMDSGFLEELQGILGQTKLTLPRVFIGGRYIGGAEEIRQLHEIGQLKKFVEGLPAAESGVCEMCGGYGFILCHECNGSHKCYSEKGDTIGFRSCTDCNENGLIRCPSCSAVAL